MLECGGQQGHPTVKTKQLQKLDGGKSYDHTEEVTVDLVNKHVVFNSTVDLVNKM